jgi:hypothetical protein
MDIHTFIENISVTATSPFAFVAYIIVILSWLYYSLNNRRLRIISSSIKDLPEKDRLKLIQKEYNTLPKEGISAQAWIKSRKQMFLLIGFISLLIAAIIIVVLSLYREPKDKDEDIEPLKDPKEVTLSNLTTERIINTAAIFSLPQNKEITINDSLSVFEILQGKSESAQDLIFDIYLKNSSKEEKILRKFIVDYRYQRGSLSSIDYGTLLKPVAEYIIDIPIDIYNGSKKNLVKPVYPMLLIDSKDSESKGLASFRLQLHYSFVGSINYHPCYNWNIIFSLKISYGEHDTLTIFEKKGWKSMIYK